MEKVEEMNDIKFVPREVERMIVKKVDIYVSHNHPMLEPMNSLIRNISEEVRKICLKNEEEFNRFVEHIYIPPLKIYGVKIRFSENMQENE